MLLFDFLKSNAVDASRQSVMLCELAEDIDKLRSGRKVKEVEEREKLKADLVASLSAQLEAAKAAKVNKINDDDD